MLFLAKLMQLLQMDLQEMYFKTTEGLGKFVKRSLKESLFKSVLSKNCYCSSFACYEQIF